MKWLGIVVPLLLLWWTARYGRNMVRRKVEALSRALIILITGDRDQLGQVIVNLVMNAVDAMEQEGTMTLRTYRDKPAGKAYIEVSDTGRGIPKKDLPLIFDPFFTTKAPGKGTGLGLSTAYGIIKENQGRIWVKETSERGTTFAVELPLYRPSSRGKTSF